MQCCCMGWESKFTEMLIGDEKRLSVGWDSVMTIGSG